MLFYFVFKMLTQSLRGICYHVQWYLFTARRYASAVLAVVVSPSVCPSVCLSVGPLHGSTVSDRLNVGSRK